MEVRFEDEQGFFRFCKFCVENGLTFCADHAKLVVEMLGGY